VDEQIIGNPVFMKNFWKVRIALFISSRSQKNFPRVM